MVEVCDGCSIYLTVHRPRKESLPSAQPSALQSQVLVKQQSCETDSLSACFPTVHTSFRLVSTQLSAQDGVRMFGR